MRKVWKKLRKALNPYSVRGTMILSFMLLISIIVLLVSLVSYYYTMNDIESISINYTVRLLGEINASIDSYIDNMKSMAKVVVENKDVRDVMAFYNRHHDKRLSYIEEKELERLRANAAAHMNIVANTRSDITNIAVISKYKDVVLSDVEKEVNENSEFNVTDWYLKPMSYKDEIVVSPSHVQNLVSGEYKWVISISKSVLDPETGEVTGVMVIDLNYRSIEAICENAQLGKNGYIYLIDRHKNIIYHPQQQLLYSGIKSELVEEILKMRDTYLRDDVNNRIYTRNYSELTGWSAVGVVNVDELIKDKSSIIDFYFRLAGISILFAMTFAVLISTTITNPIKMLENTMHEVEVGNFDVRSEIELNNEIGHLSKTFNVMISRIKDLMEKTVRDEEEKRRSEIRALQAQINPHFLYNTLDTIIWMSAGGKNDEVVEVTSALARLFRTSISKGENLVTLLNEVENIKSYLTIQKMRYEDKLSWRVDVPPELLGLMTPKLILQPIVENAVYHGIKMSQAGGEIAISARTAGDRLTITIADSGVGMTAEQLEQLFVPRPDTDRGIGVINVNNRIRLCFGEEYGLHYFSAPGEGTRVEIWLPVIEGGDEDDV
ncbi:sensor histidine kinase [Anaerotruncus massiliensis (ex Liu et al. 2021)]|uniref:histidine kinase n=2 Tax=Anaerotruncus TaxID=244127 RepID=A0A498CR53_9FIRM|nr:sensor histidine kinase [Anaerotruncus massiliensis (ex Liu et al. 2021)]MBC3938777.1 sensor histidine kinase [Anaerotruncus massiliensis (ex Togo et al. 2019)]RLL11033.1 sensor histidine kinase [Anaerotruncus massiliensis (ex Liu et al. 2021)]